MVDLNSLLLPPDWSLEQLETQARRVYFEELVPNPPVLAIIRGIENRPLEITNNESAFQHLFGESEG
jgi:hypothetical protein